MKHVELPKKSVVIELLVAEGIVWAGWYRPANLLRKWDEVQGSFMQGGRGGGVFRKAMIEAGRKPKRRG
jgi:hypothetical protein